MCATIPILDFEVPRCRIFTEIAAEIPFVAVPKMKVSDLVDIWVGGVGNINELPVDKVSKKVPIGLPPLLCFVGFLGLHGAVMWRMGSGVVLWGDHSTVSMTNAGAKRSIIDVGYISIKCTFFSIWLGSR